jgi:hypothetical protein
LGGRHEVALFFYKDSGLAIDYAIAQAKCITHCGNPMLGGLHNGKAPSLFAGGHEVGIGTREQGVLIVFRNLAAKAHAIGHAELFGIIAQVRLPPARANHIQNRARRARHRIHGVLNLLVWD